MSYVCTVASSSVVPIENGFRRFYSAIYLWHADASCLFSSGRSGRMAKAIKVVFDGSVFRTSGPVNLKAGKKYTITVRPLLEEADAEQDPAFDIASLAVTTNIPDFSYEHDHYLHGLPKRGAHER